jgi:hypothetical protein
MSHFNGANIQKKTKKEKLKIKKKKRKEKPLDEIQLSSYKQ